MPVLPDLADQVSSDTREVEVSASPSVLTRKMFVFFLPHPILHSSWNDGAVVTLGPPT